MSVEIKSIFEQFNVHGRIMEHTRIVSGHINDTYLIKTDHDSYVLQRINHKIFTSPADVMTNKVLVARHLESKLQGLPEKEIQRRVLRFGETRAGGSLYTDKDGNFWNLMIFIEDSVVFPKTPDKNIAFEAGKAFGKFLADTEDLDPSLLVETLPEFHSMSRRFSQFDDAVETASKERLHEAKDLIGIANDLRNEMHGLEQAVKTGLIPYRATHNDTKISNVLFSKEGEALCVIDLDTVMRGVVHFDFGDAVRTICSSGDEDESDISNVDFNLDYFRAFVDGFVGNSGIRLSEAELEGLALSAKIMTFIIGLRFLTDFLNGDTYFETRYESHNFIRARNQFRLVSLIGDQIELLTEIIESSYRESKSGTH